MKIIGKVLPAVCCISMLSACATNRPVREVLLPIRSTTNHIVADSSEALYKTGRYYQEKNRYDMAIRAYQKSLAVNNSFVGARNGLGVIFAKQGKYQESIEAFQLAIKQAPNASYLYSNMGYAYYLQGQYAASISALEQATLLEPTNQAAFNNLALVYAKTSNNSGSPITYLPALGVPAISNNESVIDRYGPLKEMLPLAQSANGSVVDVSGESFVQAIPKAEMQIKSTTQMMMLQSTLSTDQNVSELDSHVQLVQLSPNVSELRMRHEYVEPRQNLMANGSPGNLGKFKLEVSNGNGSRGIAGKVANFLLSQGYSATRLTNQKSFQIRMTQIQYRYGHQAEAELLQSNFPEVTTLVQSDDLRMDISIRLVLGKDILPKLAHSDVNRSRYGLFGNINA